MHPDAWRALRRVSETGCAGDSLLRARLMVRGLVEWVPGESGLRLTRLGAEALRGR